MARARLTLDEFFAGHGASAKVFAAVAQAVDSIGEAEVRATRSQVAFRRKRAFAWAWMPGQYLSGQRPPLVLSVSLPRHDGSKRWKEVVEPRSGRFMHHLELRSADQVDDQVVEWLREAWSAAG